MKIKKVIFKILIYALAFYFIANVLDFIEVNDEIVTWVWILGGMSTATFLYKFVLKFATVKANFVTAFFTVLVISAVTSFALDLLIPGFDINAGTFGPIDLNFAVITGFPLDTTTAKVFMGMLYALLIAVLELLAGHLSANNFED